MKTPEVYRLREDAIRHLEAVMSSEDQPRDARRKAATVLVQCLTTELNHRETIEKARRTIDASRHGYYV